MQGRSNAVRMPSERQKAVRTGAEFLANGLPEHSFFARLQGRLNAVRSPSGRPKGRPDGDPENEEYSWYLGLFLCMTIYTLLCVSGG